MRKSETVENIIRLEPLRKRLRGEDLRRLEEVLSSMRSSVDERVSKTQAAELLGISRQTLDRWIEKGVVATSSRQVSLPDLQEIVPDVQRIREDGTDRVLRALEELRKPAQSGAGKKTAGKKSAAKKSPAQKTSAKKAAARKSATKKSATKKSAAKKSAAKKSAQKRSLPG